MPGLATIALMILAVGCEAHTTVVTPILLPPGFATTQDRLHVQVLRAASFSRTLSLPGGLCPDFDPTSRTQARGTVTQTDRGYELSQSAIPSVPEFCVAAWLDTNRNDRIDSGDAVGRLVQPYPCQPSKLSGSNRHRSAELMLVPVP